MYVNMKTLLAAHTPKPIIKKTKPPESPTASTSSTPKESPSKKKLSPSTSEVTASPAQSPTLPPTTLSISKNVAAGGGRTPPTLSPSSPRSPHRPKSKSPKKSAR